MKIIFFIIILCLFSIDVHAQQQGQFSEYMYNTVVINPAYAGSRNYLSAFGLHRSQWIGLEGAPISNSFSVNAPISDSSIGLGLGILREQIGPSNQTNLSTSFSYTIRANDSYKLSFGISGHLNFLYVDYSKLNIHDAGDAVFESNLDAKFSPNLGGGIYLHSEKMYVSFSIPTLLETKYFNGNTNTTAATAIVKERTHYYFSTGYVFKISDDFKFKPAILTKVISGAPIQVDFSGNFLINKKVVLGAAYRWQATLSELAGFQISDSWFVGYAYDLEKTRLANYNNGSHEIFLRFELTNSGNRVVAPRFF